MSELTTNLSELLGRPHYGAVGDPTTAAGADMVPLGLLPRALWKPTFFTQRQNNEIGQIIGNGYEACDGGTFTLSLKRRSVEILTAFFSSIVAGADSLGYKTDLSARSQVTLCLIPKEVADPTDPTEATLKWVTNAHFMDLGDFVAKLERSDESDLYTITGVMARAATDQQGQELLTNYQIAFEGSAVNALTGTVTNAWTLPAQT